jgi:Mce-associated membrane protein
MSDVSTTPRRSGLLLLAGVLTLAALAFFAWAYVEQRTDHVDNHAVVDVDATTEVQTEVSQALVRVFSYDYSNPAPTLQAADELLVGEARTEYDTLFAQLEEKAPGQQLLLTAQVQIAAVKELSDGRASLLVFVDQAAQRASDDESSISAAQLSVDAEVIDGTWKVTGLQTL